MTAAVRSTFQHKIFAITTASRSKVCHLMFATHVVKVVMVEDSEVPDSQNCSLASMDPSHEPNPAVS